MRILLFLAIFSFLPFHMYSQSSLIEKSAYDSLFQGLKFRNIGPFRGGRTNCVSGVVDKPDIYYMGTVGGGIWKSVNGGISWKNISDGYFKVGSIGAIAVSESNPNIIYAGTGEHAVRGVMSSHGDGIYKSDDGGKTWNHLGLKETRHISRIRIHPKNPDIVFVAAQGQLYGPNSERGIYKSTNGGKDWQKVLFINDQTGASDLSMDMNNPRILYAAMWDYQRFPWKIRSGGPASGIYKSIDQGENWEELTDGLPEEMGKIGVDVSRANPNIVYANIEAEKGGVYKSVDRGKKWMQVCDDRVTIARAWYYIKIYADPIEEDRVYVMNAPFLKSTDGGKSFQQVKVPHGDQHDLWINPKHPEIMINSNDGGANVTYNNGKNWSAQDNQPTAQFYRVITDNQFPYRLYGGQQDNSSVSIANRTNSIGIGWKDWYASAGGESAFIAFNENNPELVYGGSYQGNIQVQNIRTKHIRDIMAYPVMGLGSTPIDMKYRFNWNAPIVTDPFQPGIIYHAGNKVLKSTDEGKNWIEISEDLTRNEKEKQSQGGGPYTNEGAGGENYNTISYLACSPLEKGQIWVGSDDGLIHISIDGGENWTNITPPGLEECLINSIEISRHTPGTAYIAMTRYKFNDLRPYVYKTTNYGRTWTQSSKGIDADAYVRVVRQDPIRKELLFAGTETGLFISFDQGSSWRKFQSNLPITPITDLTIRDNDLIVATAGRSFWILDDLGPLQQHDSSLQTQLYTPKANYKFGIYAPAKPIEGLGQNPPGGLNIDYCLSADMDSSELRLQIFDSNDNLIREFTNQKDPKDKSQTILQSKKGMHRFYWNYQKEKLPKIEGLKLLLPLHGHTIPPGEYRIALISESDSLLTIATIKADPRIKASAEDYKEQYDFLNQVENQFREIHETVNRLRKIKSQISELNDRIVHISEASDLIDTGKVIIQKIDTWEEHLVQVKQETFQDIINFPNQLNAELLNLKSRMDGLEPFITSGARTRLNDLQKQWEEHKSSQKEIEEVYVKMYNEMYQKLEIPALVIPE